MTLVARGVPAGATTRGEGTRAATSTVHADPPVTAPTRPERAARATARAARRLWPASRFGRVLLLLVLAGFALRVVAVAAWAREPQGLHDPSFYARSSEAIAAGDGYRSLAGEPTAYFPPGYPFVLAAAIWVGDRLPGDTGTPVIAGLLNAVLGAVTVAFMGLAARRLLGDRAGLWCAALVAFYPNLVLHSATILSETLFNALVAAALFVAVGGRQWPLSNRRAALAGALLGAATLVRPVALLVVPFLLAAWWMSDGWRTGLRRVGVLAGVTVLVVLPWTVRNAVQLDAFVPISTNTGDNLCIGHHADATGAFNASDRCFAGIEGLGEVERDDELTRRAVEYATDHPVDEISLTWWRFFWQYDGDYDGLRAIESYGADPFLRSDTREVLRALSNGYYFAVVGFGLVGLVAMWNRRAGRRLTFYAFLAGLFVAPLLFFGDQRFKVPVVLLLCLPAAVTLAAFPRIRERAAPAEPADA